MKRFSTRKVSLIVIFSVLASGLFAQTFTEQTGIVLPGVSNGSTLLGDADNDGDIDILIAGYDASNSMLVRLYRNNGSGIYADAGNVFSPVLPAPYGNYTKSVHWVDFDNDGFLDILLNSTTIFDVNNLLVYHHEADHSYLLKSTIEFWSWQGNSVDCGDYDNDGDQDILLTTHNSSKIFQNQGSFAFVEQTSIALNGLSEGSSKFGDYDNDGDLDIMITGFKDASYSGSCIIYKNNSNNSFTLQSTIVIPGAYDGSAEWGDYNNDGYLDILLTGKNNNSRIYKNNGNNSFSYQPVGSLPFVTESAGKWGDLDNDGDLDMVLSGKNNNLGFSKAYINNGNNTFSELAGFSVTGVFQSSIDLFDYDNDRDLDLIISGDAGGSKITKVFRNGSAVNNPVPSAPTNLTATAVGNDIILKWNSVRTDNTPYKALSYNVMVGTSLGAVNVISPNAAADGFHRISGMGNCQTDTTFILRNLPRGVTYYWKVQAVDNSWKGGTFTAGPNFAYTALIQASSLNVPVKDGASATLAWTRGNGTNCVVFLKEANTGTAIPSNGSVYTSSSVFKSGTQILATGWYCVYNGAASKVSVTNLKANTDYIFQVFEYTGTTYDISTLTGNPLTFKTGSFSELKTSNLLPVTTVSTSGSPTLSFWVDFDNDAGNDLDLIMLGTNASRIYRNDGSGIFTELASPFGTGYSASCGDYNNDGLIDIAIANYPEVRLFKNTGGGTFAEQGGALPVTGQYGSLDWGDYNNDGDLDILITGSSSLDGRFSKIFRNNGDNTFTEQLAISLEGLAYGSAKWVDYDNDGFLDLIIAGGTNSASYATKIYRNNGNNSFTEQTGINISPTSSSSIDWGDFDNDGDPDLIITGFNLFTPITKIYRNNGNNSFTDLPSTGLPVVNNGSAKWGDYDADGDLDILITGYNGFYNTHITKIFTNNGNANFTEDLSCIFPGLGVSSGNWGDYDKDGDLDIILTGNTPEAGIARIYRNDIGVVNTAPSAPIGLTSDVTLSDVALKWKSVRTDNTPYKAMTYNLRVGTSSGAINIVSPHSLATGLRSIVTSGNMLLDTTFLFKKMAFGTYYWSVQAVDNGFTGSAFSGEGTFIVSPVQAKSLSARTINSNSLLLKWERGNGDRCVVFAKQTSTGTSVPVNNTGYVADPELGFGSQISTSGWHCVYNGRADSVVVTGLIASKQYSFHIIEYMGTFGSEQYFTVTADGNPGVFSTSRFTEQTAITLNSGIFNNVVWGDYDNDGLADILIPGSPTTRIYRNNGNNTFSEKTGIALPSVNYGCAEWGDYDRDGDLDIIITGATSNYPAANPVTKIFQNDGSDIFTEQTAIVLPQLLYSAVAWGDYDNDGDPDILLSGATGTDPNYIPVSKIYRNNGNKTFTEQTQITLTPLFKGSVRWMDYDNDGDLDIAMTGAIDNLTYNQGITQIYKNNGNSTFTLQNTPALSGAAYSATSWGDFDNDCDLDVILTAMGVGVIFQNMGNNTFLHHYSANLPYQGAAYAAWGDYDNDGYLDIILSNPGLDTKIYRNTHGLTVPGAVTQWFNRQDDDAVKSIGYSFVNWIDFDNDGDLDFLMSKDTGLPTKIFKNNLIMKSGQFKTNTSPGAPTGLKAINSPTGVVLSWKPVHNDETPSSTMTYNVRIGTLKTNFNISPSHSSSTGYREIASIGNAQLDTTLLLLNMPAIKYYWSVQAVDQGLKGGAWSATDSVDVKNVLSFFSADTVCEGLSTQFTNQSVAFGDVIQSYKWVFGDGVTSTLTSPTHIFSSAGVKNVTLITYSATTSDTLIKQVLIKAKPIVDFSTSVACHGSETVIENLSNVTGLTITSWSWDYGDGKGSTVQNPGTHGYLTAGDYQLTLTANADNLCSSFITKTVSVGAIPVASISASTPLSFCSGDSVSLSVAKNSSYLYTWKSGGVVYLTGQDSSKYIAKNSGAYYVEVVNPTGNCLTTSSTATVTVLNAPSAPGIISGKTPAVFCQGDSVSLSVTNTIGYNYSWKLNGGSVGSNKNEYFARNSGRYTLIVSNSTGCQVESSNFKDVTVNPLPSISAVTPSGATTFCDGGNVTLSVPLIAGNSYFWYDEAVPIPNATTNSYTANSTGKYVLVVTNATGCVTKTTPVNITVNPLPLKPNITSEGYQTGDCPPVKNKVKLITSEVSGYTYQWFKNGVVYSDRTNTYVEEKLPQGVYSVETSLNGCKTLSDNFNISYAAAPEIPNLYAKGPVVWYLATQFKSYKYYKWYFNDQQISGANKYIYVANKKLGTYRVEVANENLCYTSSADKIIPTTISGMKNFTIPAEFMTAGDTDPISDIRVYPNPGNGLFNLEIDDEHRGDLKISVYRFDGKEIFNIKTIKDSDNFKYQVDLTGQPDGNYLIKFELNNTISVKKIIIE